MALLTMPGPIKEGKVSSRVYIKISISNCLKGKEEMDLDSLRIDFIVAFCFFCDRRINQVEF